MFLQNDQLPGDLGQRWAWGPGEARRGIARKKLLFYAEDHLALVRQRIEQRIQDDKARPLVAEFASRVNNLVRSVVEAVAVAYSRGCRRELRDLGASAAAVFTQVVNESGMTRLAGSVNALSWLLGPVLVGPCLIDNELSLDIVTPAANEVRLSGAEKVRAALWRVGTDWVELDADTWRYYDGEVVGVGLYKTEPHGVGRCPLSIFRCDSFVGFDLFKQGWWAPSEHGGLIDASLDVAYKHAFGLWTRQNGSTKLTVINALLEGIPAGQTIADPAMPLVVYSPNTSPVSVFDRSVNPDEYLREMAAIVEAAVSRYGIPPSEVTFRNDTGNWGNLSISVRGERLGLLRDKQVPWLLHAEQQLWPMVCDFIRGSTHRLARVMPPGDEVRGALHVAFPDLANPDDVKKSVEALQAGLGLGLDSPTDFMMRRRPELTRDEAERERLANIDDYAKGIEMVTSRNIPTDNAGRGVESIAQIQGREGGRLSGEARNTNEAA